MLLRDQTGRCVDCGRPTRYSGHWGETYPFAARCPTCASFQQRKIDRDEVVRLRLEHNLTTLEIAAHLSASQPQVSRILIDLDHGIGRDFRRRAFGKRRYVIRSVTGYPFAPGGNEALSSWSVLDSAYSYVEVACFYADDVRGAARRRRLARRECARLNARDQLGILEEAA